MLDNLNSSQKLDKVQMLSVQLTSLLETMSGEGHEVFEAMQPIQRHNLLWLALDLSKQIDQLAYGILPAEN